VLAAHLMTTAQGVGQALRRMFPERARVALLVAGLEVPHTHLHVFCIDSMHQLDLAAADHEPDPAGLDDIAARLRTELS
jgi:histidine triad (HIT) family protein